MSEFNDKLLNNAFKMAQLQQMQNVAAIRRILQQATETPEDREAKIRERVDAAMRSIPHPLSPKDVDSLAEAAEEARAQESPYRIRRTSQSRDDEDYPFYVENDLPGEGYVQSQPAPAPPPQPTAPPIRRARVPDVSPVPTAEPARPEPPVAGRSSAPSDLPSMLKHIAEAQQQGLNIQEWLDRSFTAEEQAKLNPDRLWEVWESVANLTQINRGSSSLEE